MKARQCEESPGHGTGVLQGGTPCFSAEQDITVDTSGPGPGFSTTSTPYLLSLLHLSFPHASLGLEVPRHRLPTEQRRPRESVF